MQVSALAERLRIQASEFSDVLNRIFPAVSGNFWHPFLFKKKSITAYVADNN